MLHISFPLRMLSTKTSASLLHTHWRGVARVQSLKVHTGNFYACIITINLTVYLFTCQLSLILLSAAANLSSTAASKSVLLDISLFSVKRARLFNLLCPTRAIGLGL